jgi:polyphosphate kinase 1
VTDLHLAVEAPAVKVDLRHPSLYLNRELSWLEFNGRVLHEALDPRTPLLERVKFLAIFSNNLDEFFQIRVAGLKRQVAAGVSELTPDGLTPEEQLRLIGTAVAEQTARHRRCLLEELLPGLAKHGVRLITELDELSSGDRDHLERYFRANVFPVLTPLAVDPGHPFPYISNLSLSLAVVLRDADGEERFARVKVPKILPRWVPLPTASQYVPLEYIIGANLDALFPGVEILGWYTFRITRNTELELDEDEADDLLSHIQEEVRNRRFGEVVRLEVHTSMPGSLRQLLLAEFNEEQESPALFEASTMPLRSAPCASHTGNFSRASHSISSFNVSRPSSYRSTNHTKPIGELKHYSGYGGQNSQAVPCLYYIPLPGSWLANGPRGEKPGDVRTPHPQQTDRVRVWNY